MPVFIAPVLVLMERCRITSGTFIYGNTRSINKDPTVLHYNGASNCMRNHIKPLHAADPMQAKRSAGLCLLDEQSFSSGSQQDLFLRLLTAVAVCARQY